MENNIIINSVDPQTFEFQDYSTSDETLLAINELDTVFSGSIDYIEAYVYDENKNIQTSQVPFTNYKVTEGDVVLTPSNDLERLGFDVGSYYISYDFYRPRLASTLNTRYYISEISSDKTEIRLDSTQIDNALLISSSLEFISYRDTAEYFVDFLLNFGNNQQVIANNIELDLTDEDNPTILIKLYEALPASFSLKTQCSVVEQISTPQSYNIIFPPLKITQDDFTYISGPNYSLNIKGQSGTPGMDFSYNTLVNSNITSSFNQVNNLLNRKEIDINVNYEDYNDFVYFSSAYTRLQNFYYKVGLIQSSSLQLGQITSATTGSIIYSSSQAALSQTIQDTIKNFDGYEYFLYFNSGSQDSYPKSNTEPPFTLYSTGSNEVLTWLGSTDTTDPYYGGQAVSSSDFDENNQNSLYYAIPEYLRSDIQNAKYELFVDMVGQHYDNLWMYTKNITTKFDADNRLDYGISKDMVADAIRDFGVKLYSNNFNTNDLYTTFLGLTPSGSSFPFPYMTGSIGGVVNTPSGYEYVDSTISASNDIVPLDDVNKRLYKRIYHNIPYLLKTKGTVAGLRALITSYGIPDTILRINEFGGKDRNNSMDWDLKQDIYNVGLNTTSSAFSSSFVLNTDWEADQNSPGSIQFRFKTNGIPSSSSAPTTQSIFISDSPSKVAMGVEYNESLLTTGTYSGAVPSKFKEYGTLKFWPNMDTNPTNYASLYLPFWDGGWWSIQVDRDYSNNTFTLRAANKIGENIGFTGSDNISADTQQWENSNEIHWLPQTYTQLAGINYFPLSGSFQEVRYYVETLSESIFYDYTMNPYSFEGNNINSAPDTLAFRLPLGSLLNTGSYEDSIHPKITGSWVTTSSFNNQSTASFSSIPTWLNNVEDIHLDQTPSGMRNRVTDKIQTEALILPEGDTLSGYRSIQQTSYVSESFTPNVNYLEVAFSPQDQINDDIIGQMGYFNIGDYIGDPRLISSSDKSYPDLDVLRDAYFEKYITNYNVTDFVRLIKFFDNSLFKMIEDFTPARTSLSSGVVIKQHLLERNRQRPAQVTSSFEQYSGSVRNLPKNYSLGSTDYPQYSDSGSAIYKFSGGTAGSFEPFNSLKTTVSGSLGLGTDNRYFVTQSWDESWMTFSGSAPIDRSDQREFYNGEFSGSVIPVGMNDMCSAYFKISNIVYRYIPVFFSADGASNTQTLSQQSFLDPLNQPPTGFAWFWSDGESILFIKMSLVTSNGINIGTFIRNVEWVVFTFNSAVDAQGNILEGIQTFYLESVGIQPANQSANPLSVGTALCYVIPEISSTVISSDDGAFYDFNFSASGDFQWYATQNTALDPSPLLDTGISESVPQGYFPLTYHTESFFRGWASSNFYTNGTFNSYDGELMDSLNNFNTGSHEKDNTDTTTTSTIDPANNVPWFMNAANPEGEGKNWIQIPSESFLDYENIPDSSVGPTSTNNYFNIAWTSASSAVTPAIQGTNYYYNASNNAIYMSGSEFQNELKQSTPLYTSSLVSQIITNQNTTPSSWTPVGQSSLTIPLDTSRGQELWVYQGDNNGNPYQGNTFVGYDKNAWRYNRYIHRPYKVYYVTETGSGQQGEPYGLYDPMITLDRNGPPVYYNNATVNFATMLGTTGDALTPPRGDDYYRPLNASESMPALTMVSGSFNIFNEDRQVRPFLFTTYARYFPPPGSDTFARGSGSSVSISQSDGTPFATLRMYQNQQPPISSGGGAGTAFLITCNSLDGDPCVLIYWNAFGNSQTLSIPDNSDLVVCGEEGRNASGANSIVIYKDQGTFVSSQLDGNPNPCIGSIDEGDGSTNSSNINQRPMFYRFPYQEVNVGNVQNQTYNVPYGEFFDGENTSSLSLTTGTQPGGDSSNPEIVFPQGSYIFTMSDFDTTTFQNGRTEFGLWTTYGDYANYNFSNEIGSNANPVTINYINSNYENTSIDVYEYATLDADGDFNVITNGNGTYVGDERAWGRLFRGVDTKFQRINIEVSGDYNAKIFRSVSSDRYVIKVYKEPNQTATGATPSSNAQELFQTAPNSSPPTTQNLNTFLTGLLEGEQLLVLFINNNSSAFTGTKVFEFKDFYNLSLSYPRSIVAAVGSPTAVEPFTDPFVVTGSIAGSYEGGAEVPGAFATKVVDAYIVYSSSLSASLDGAYVFDITPTFGILSVTASVLVSSFTDAGAALYGNAIYGEDEYGGGASGGGTTWTTASIILYTGSVDVFPSQMPSLGGNVFAETSSYSLTHHEGERITLHAELNPGDLQYNDVIKMSLRVGSGSNVPSVVENGLVVTQYSMSFSSSVITDEDPSIPAIFSDDLNFNYAYDCQPLLNNYSDGRLNRRIQEVDYNFGTVIPTNWQKIIDYSASRASIPESNYSQTNVINGRYDGSVIASQKYNVWSPGDSGGYGKLPSIDINKVNLAYFNKVYDPYPVLNNRTIYNIQYLIDQNGNATQPKLSDVALYNIQGTFEPTPIYRNGTIVYDNSALISLVGEVNETLFPLQGEQNFDQITTRPTPILYSQKSGIFPLNKYAQIVDPSDPATTIAAPEGIEMIGNEPIDPGIVPTFNNYSVDAFGDTEIFVSTRNISTETLILTTVQPEDNGTVGPQNNVTSSATAGNVTGTNKDVYDTDPQTGGLLTIPITDGGASFAAENTAGVGNSTSQAYDMQWSFYVDSEPTVNRLRTRNHEGGWKGHSPIDEPNIGDVNLEIQKKSNYSSGNFGPASIRSVKVEIVEYFNSTNASGTNNVTLNYGSIGSSYVSVNQNQGKVQVTFNTDSIRSAYQNAGYSGDPISQRLKISGKLNQAGSSNALKQGNQFRIRYNGNIITNTNGNGPKFFPQISTPTGTGGTTSLFGANSNPVTTATASFWEFSGSGAGKSTKVLVCSSPQLNKAYGRGFTQKDLVYTSSFNKDFPGGREPYFSQFPPIQNTWELQKYDQIRFENNEDYTYTIVNITPPDSNTDSNLEYDDFPSLMIELDNPVVESLEQNATTTDGGYGYGLSYVTSSDTSATPGAVNPVYLETEFGQQTFRPLDMFVIRRFVPDAGSMIVTQRFPYSAIPEPLSAGGFMVPPFTTTDLETNPDLLLQNLVDNKLIE